MRSAPPRSQPATITASLPGFVVRRAREALAEQIVSLLSDQAQPSTGGKIFAKEEPFFSPDAVVRRVHSDVTTMMIGGVAGLLLQMLHPAVLAGVWDHSRFRNDMRGRLRRTARFIAATTYGDTSDVVTAVTKVQRIHDSVRGSYAGRSYSANDPALLSWVHVTEAISFLQAWLRYGDRRMSLCDQDRYFIEMARIAEMLGADPIPRSYDHAQRLIQATRPKLEYNQRTREAALLVLNAAPPTWIAAPAQALGMQAAIDLLPTWARRMHRLPNPAVAIPLLRITTGGLAQATRWALSS